MRHVSEVKWKALGERGLCMEQEEKAQGKPYTENEEGERKIGKRKNLRRIGLWES